MLGYIVDVHVCAQYCKYLKAVNALFISESSVHRLILDSKQVLNECLLDE